MTIIIFSALIISFIIPLFLSLRKDQFIICSEKINKIIYGIKITENFINISIIFFVLTYAIQIIILLLQTKYENGSIISEYMKLLPYPVYDHRTERPNIHRIFGIFSYINIFVQTCSFSYLYLALFRNKNIFSKSMLIVLFGSFAVLSILSPAMSSLDPYEYVAAGLFGFKSYLPNPSMFEHTVYSNIYKNIPLQSVIYGPFWMAINYFETHFFTSILEKILALRIFGTAFIIATIFALKKAKFSKAILFGIGLNPAIWFYSVVTPHIEIEFLFLSVLAIISIRSNKKIFTTLLIATAGLLKIPFYFAILPILCLEKNLKNRIYIVASSLFLLGSISYLTPDYIFGFSHYFAIHAQSSFHNNFPTLMFSTMISFLVLGLLILKRSKILCGPLFMSQLSIQPSAWYIFWGIPYALADGRADFMLILLPLLTAIYEQNYYSWFYF